MKKFIGLSLLAFAWSFSAVAQEESNWKHDLLADATYTKPSDIASLLAPSWWEDSQNNMRWLREFISSWHAAGVAEVRVSNVSVRKHLFTFVGETKCVKNDPRLVHYFQTYGACVDFPDYEVCWSAAIGLGDEDPCLWDSEYKPELKWTKVSETRK